MIQSERKVGVRFSRMGPPRGHKGSCVPSDLVDPKKLETGLRTNSAGIPYT